MGIAIRKEVSFEESSKADASASQVDTRSTGEEAENIKAISDFY